MKIVHVIDSLGRGGAESLIVGLAHEMQQQGNEVSIVTLSARNEFADVLSAHGIRVYSCGFAANIYHAPQLLRLWRHFRALLATLQPDVINTHIFMSDIITRLAVGSRVPIVTTFHRDEGWWSQPQGMIKQVKRWIESFTARRFTRKFIAVSELAAKCAVAFLAIDRRQCAFIRNGVDTAKFAPDVHVDRNKPIIIQVARFYPEKAHETGLHAFRQVLSQLPDAQLWLVGDGPLREQIQTMAAVNGLASKVRFLGVRHDIATLLQQSRVFWLTSTREGIPIALLEAMATSAVPVVTSVGGIPQVIRHGENGFLYTPGDSSALAQLSVSLLKSPALFQPMAQAARADVIARYSIAETAEHYLAVYAQAMEPV